MLKEKRVDDAPSITATLNFDSLTKIANKNNPAISKKVHTYSRVLFIFNTIKIPLP